MRDSIVWVLGAGFSAGLGAPLLNGLFNEVDLEQLNRDPLLAASLTDIANRLMNIFRRGIRENRWRDAEAFVDFVDMARSDALRFETIRRLDPNLDMAAKDEWLPSLQRVMAAQCCAFLLDRSQGSEEWAPYIRWAKQLEANDTVLTFNWDRVLEELAQSSFKTSLQGDSFLLYEGQEIMRPPAYCPQVLKLHGSVDWCREEEHVRISAGEPPTVHENVKVTSDRFFALHATSGQLAIATPGPSKRAATTGYLARHWRHAREALATADAVVFIGYRFPPSDALAREVLLTAIGRTPSSSGGVRLAARELRVYTVLGPNAQSDDSARLGGLIRGALSGAGWWDLDLGAPSSRPPGLFTLRQLPLFGQDFMSIFSRQNLLAP